MSKFLRHTFIIISFFFIFSVTQVHAASTADWTTGYYPPNCVTDIIFYQPTNRFGFPTGPGSYQIIDVNGNYVTYTLPAGWTMTYDNNTGVYTSCQNSPPYAPLASFHAGVNKSTSYAPGEAVIVNVLGYNVFFNVAIGGSASFGAWSMSEANMSGCGGTDTFGVYARVCTGSFPAPTTPGTYTINVMGCSLSIYYCTGNTLTFTVVAPVTPVCSATHNNCTAGTVGATATYADRWQWWCNGSTLPANAAPNLLCQEFIPPTVTLSPFTPASINVGQTATISVSSTNATACSGTGIWNGNLGGTSITNAVTPVMNTAGTFTQSITCTGPGGSATSVTRSLTVTAVAVPTVNLWFSFLDTTKSLFSGMLPAKVFAEE
jgi:hypothetical protein